MDMDFGYPGQCHAHCFDMFYYQTVSLCFSKVRWIISPPCIKTSILSTLHTRAKPWHPHFMVLSTNSR